MKIECIGAIGVVNTKLKPYWYRRNGYYIGEIYVKPKKIRKFKTVPIKEPYLSGNIELRVDVEFVVGGVYVDENNKSYFCCSNTNFNEPSSMLKIITTSLGKTFSIPKSLALITKPYLEGSNI